MPFIQGNGSALVTVPANQMLSITSVEGGLAVLNQQVGAGSISYLPIATINGASIFGP